jgi:serine protease Do
METPAPRPKKPMSRLKLALSFILVAVIFLLVGAGGMTVYNLVRSNTNQNSLTARQAVKDDGNLKTTNQEAVVENIVEKVSPSVVSIVTNVTVNSIFGTANQEAAGSGIIVSSDGYIMTNKHVVADATSIDVVLSDGTTYDKVSLVGTDPMNDIAYLKIEGTNNLTAATLGESSTVRVGQGVIAIGNSLGQYQNTVTDGIISGKGRPVTAGSGNGGSSESLTDLLQTDAAINPGNSGGPLLNHSGQVIGINTAVAANAEGIGFAIPINAAKGTLKSVLAGKGVQRSYLGLRYVQITAELAKKYNLATKQGAYVVSEGGTAVLSGGPADKAGIKDKDIITKINGLAVGSQGGVSSLVGEYAPGDTIELTLLRGGGERTVKVTLGSYQAGAN